MRIDINDPIATSIVNKIVNSLNKKYGRRHYALFGQLGVDNSGSLYYNYAILTLEESAKIKDIIVNRQIHEIFTPTGD